MDKGPDAFRTISEVADDLDVPQHVLRFWETRFAQIKPLKRGGGRRYYRPEDVDLIKGIRHLLYGEGYTIKGVQRILKDEGLRFVQTAWREGAALPDRKPADSEGPDGEEPPGRPKPPAPASEGAAPADRTPDLLTPEQRQKLETALADLAECRRLLTLARQGDPPA